MSLLSLLMLSIQVVEVSSGSVKFALALKEKLVLLQILLVFPIIQDRNFVFGCLLVHFLCLLIFARFDAHNLVEFEDIFSRSLE